MSWYSDLFISDLHCGSVYFDILSYEKVLEKLKEDGIRVITIHLIGDLVDGKFNHAGQLYESFPVDIQIEILESVLSKMFELVEPRFVYVLPGNHDRKFGINLLDRFVEGLKKKYGDKEIKYYRDNMYYVTGNMLITHGMRGVKGSDYTGFTPGVLNNLTNIPASYGEYGVTNIVCGHFHTFSMVHYHGYNMIMVPSFLHGERPLREVRGVVLYDEFKGVKPILVQPSKREEILEYWRSKFI